MIDSKLRSVPLFIAALLISTLVGGIIFGLEVVVGGWIEGDNTSWLKGRELSVILSSAEILTPLCFTIELLFFAPALCLSNIIGSKFNINESIVFVNIGFLIGVIPALFVFSMPLDDVAAASHRNFANGHATLHGWLMAAIFALMFGLVGAACAAVFSLIALRPSTRQGLGET